MHEILAAAALKFAQSDKAETLPTYAVERDGGDAPMSTEDNALVTVMHAFTFEQTTDKETNGKNTEVLRNIANNLGYLVNSEGLKDTFSYDALGDAIHENKDYGNYTNNDGTRVHIRHGWEEGWNGNKHDMEKGSTDPKLDTDQKWLPIGSPEQEALLETKEQLVAMGLSGNNDLIKDNYGEAQQKLEELLYTAMKQCINADGVFCEESFHDVLEAAGYDRNDTLGGYFNQVAARAIRRFAMEAENSDLSISKLVDFKSPRSPGEEGRDMSIHDNALVTIMHAFTFDQKNNGGVLGDLIDKVGNQIQYENAVASTKLFTSDALGDAIHMDHAYAGDNSVGGDQFRVLLRKQWEKHMGTD